MSVIGNRTIHKSIINDLKNLTYTVELIQTVRTAFRDKDLPMAYKKRHRKSSGVWGACGERARPRGTRSRSKSQKGAQAIIISNNQSLTNITLLGLLHPPIITLLRALRLNASVSSNSIILSTPSFPSFSISSMSSVSFWKYVLDILLNTGLSNSLSYG